MVTYSDRKHGLARSSYKPFRQYLKGGWRGRRPGGSFSIALCRRIWPMAICSQLERGFRRKLLEQQGRDSVRTPID